MKDLMKWSKAHTILSIAIVGGVGYYLWNRYNKETSKSVVAAPSTPAAAPSAPASVSFTGDQLG